MENTLPRSSLRCLIPWLMWGAGAIFYFYEFFVQVSPAAMVPEWMHDFAITASGIGVLSSVYFWSYALMQIPAGLFLDRLGPRRLLAFASFMCALGCLMLGFSSYFTVALISRLFMGIGSAFAAIGCMKLAANWFSTRRFALLTGLMVMIGMLGAIKGETRLPALVETLGWRHCMIYLGVIGTLLGSVFLIFVRDQEDELNAEPNVSSSHPDTTEIITGLKKVFRNRQIWLAAIYGGLMYGPTPTLGALWGGQFLHIRFGVTKAEAGASVALIFWGWVIASPLGGFLSDKMGRRLPLMIIGSLGSLLSISAVLYIPHLTLSNANILLFIFGVFSSGFLPAFSIVRESCPKHSTATALGFMNMMNMLGVSLSQPLIGKLLDFVWLGTLTEQGIRHYTLLDYQKALSIIPIAIFLSLCLLPFIKETYCKFLSDEET